MGGVRVVLAALVGLGWATPLVAQAPPNFVIVLADDLGHGDVGPYDHDSDPGTPDVTNTPVLDALAEEGVWMTDFYANSSVCSPSRVALMTGRHSIRSGITHAIPPGSPHGIPDWELTLPELLAPLGYRSSIVGKWHCGSAPEYWPLEHGFDEFFGILSSNNSLPLLLVHDATLVATNPPLEPLTQDFTAEAVQFIEQSVADRVPFFLYFAHTNVHTPLVVQPAFDGITGRGLLADSIFEMDWSLGQVLDTLVAEGVEQDTLVVFLSDNGACNGTTSQVQQNHPLKTEPWRWVCGSNAPFSGYKGDSSEGGLRVTFAARWPGVLPAGVTRNTLASAVDLLPTLVGLAGGALPADRVLDGEDLFAAWTHDAPRVRDELHFYSLFYGAQFGNRELRATRRGRIKQYFDPGFVATDTYDLQLDPTESSPLGDPVLAASLSDTARSFDCSLDARFTQPTAVYTSLGAPVIASSSVGCNTSSLVSDGRVSTRWETSTLGAHSLELDLGQARPVTSGVAVWGAMGPCQFSLEASLDGNEWVAVLDGEACQGGTQAFGVGRAARFFRLSLQVTAGPARLRELRFFGPPGTLESTAK